MRILLVTHSYPPFGVAGVERLSEQSAHTLAALGHEVIIFTRRPSSAPSQPRTQRVTHNQQEVILVSGGGFTHGQFPLFETLDRLFETCLLEVSPDVVLIAHSMHHSPSYVFIAHKWSLPVVEELHDFDFACERAHLERVNGDLCEAPRGARHVLNIASAVRVVPWPDGH